MEQGIRGETDEARKRTVAATAPFKTTIKQEPTQTASARWYVLSPGLKADTGICRMGSRGQMRRGV